MENINLPFRYWMITIGLMSATQKCFSAMEIHRQLSHKQYEPICSMLHKSGMFMGNGDNNYQLDGFLELDEGYFEGHKLKNSNHEPKMHQTHQNKGRRQVKVLVMIQSTPVDKANQNPIKNVNSLR